MEKRTVTRPTHPPRHARPRRVHPRPESRTNPEPEPQIAGGGGSSGRGPFDDDEGGRKPERPNDGRTKLLIALGILAMGAGVMTARLLSKNSAGRNRAG